MRIPIDPLPALDPLKEPVQVHPTLPSPAATKVGKEAILPSFAQSGLKNQDRKKRPQPDLRTQVAKRNAASVDYVGDERRVLERRVARKAALLDTRAERDRRANNPDGVDTKI